MAVAIGGPVRIRLPARLVEEALPVA